MEGNKVLYEVKPKFNFIYEIFMPAGKKTRQTLGILILFVIVYFALNMVLGLNNFKSTVIEMIGINAYNIFFKIYFIVMALLAIKIIGHVVIQVLQYNAIKYTFYNDYLEYSDTFLNQQKKTIIYDNIREIEIRKNVWDRINGYGRIIIYTSAEKLYDNGLILYSIKESQEAYRIIDEIVHAKKVTVTNNEVTTAPTNVNEINEISQEEKEFEDSINNNVN